MLKRVTELLRWIVNLDVAVLVGACVVVVSSYVLVKTIDEVVEGETDWFDHRVMEWAASLHLRPAVTDAVRDVTALGGVTVLTLMTTAVATYLLVRRRWQAAMLLLINAVGAVIASGLMKHYFERDRPHFAEHGAYTYTSSFPSGHSMLSTTMYLTLAVLLARLEKSRWLRVYFVCAALLLAFLVGVSRVLLGVHWPTDVLAGWSAGVLWATIGWFVVRYLQRRGAVERSADPGDYPATD